MTSHLLAAFNGGLLLASLIEANWFSVGCFSVAAMMFWMGGNNDRDRAIRKARGEQ